MSELLDSIEDQIILMKKDYLSPESIRLETFQQMTKLLELFVKYIKKDIPCKKTNQRLRSRSAKPTK